jgi:AraC-like DNA-binding protein
LHVTAESAEEWAGLCDSFVPMSHRYRDPRRCRVQLTAQQTAGYTLLRTEKDGDEIAARTPSHLCSGPDDFYWVVLPERGAYAVAESDTPTSITVGHAMIMRLDRPWRLHMPSSVAYAMQLPRLQIDYRLPGGAAPDAVLDLGSGLGRVVRSMIRETHAQQGDLNVREFSAVCEGIAELLCMIAVGDLGPQRAHAAETAEQVRRFVRENAGTADLRLSEVARSLDWSPRQLRLALHQAGTTYREVRQDETLRIARDLLTRNGPHAMAVGEVAVRCGFTRTWFSEAFKARYGETPREYQKRVWAVYGGSTAASTAESGTGSGRLGAPVPTFRAK